MPPAINHICFVLPAIAGSGAERSILRLGKALIERGYRVDLLLLRFSGGYKSEIPKEISIYYLRYPLRISALKRIVFCYRNGISNKRLWVHPWKWIHARRAIRKEWPRYRFSREELSRASAIALYIVDKRPDILFSALARANQATVLGKYLTATDTPVVASIHNNPVGLQENILSLERALCSRANATVFVSRELMSEGARILGTPPDKAFLLHNPIPSDEIFQKSSVEVRHPWFNDRTVPLILTVGRAAHQKDYPTLIKAFAHLRHSRKARLVIMGKKRRGLGINPILSQLESLSVKYGIQRDLEILDFDENPFRYMRKASLFVLSSRYEGLPTVLIEAMACGTPVVSTDCPYGPKEILEGGKWGKLVPSGDAHALSKAMNEVLEGDVIEGSLLRQRARNFSVKSSLNACEALFHRVLHPSP